MKFPPTALLLHHLRFDWLDLGVEGGGSRLYSSALFAFLCSSLLSVTVASLPLSLALGMMFAITAVLAFVGILGDVAVTFLDPRDVSFLHTVPVSSPAYFWSRVVALGVGLLHQTMIFGLIPAVVFSTGGRGPWFAAAIYLPLLFCLMSLLAAVAATFLLGMQRFLDPARLRDFLVWMQVLLFVAATVGWLALFGAEVEAEALSRLFAGGNDTLPWNWFARAHLWLTGAAVFEGWPECLALASPLVVLALLVPLSSRYIALLSHLARPSSRSPRHWMPPWVRWFERAIVLPRERAAFHLGRALLRRERTFRLQAYPLLAYPLLFLWVGSGDRGDDGLFALIFSHFATVTLPLAAVFLRYSDQPQAGWVFATQSLVAPEHHHRGALKAFLFATVLPLYLIVTVLLVVSLGPLPGVLNGFFALGVAALVLSRTPAPPNEVPFAAPFSGSIQLGKASDGLFGLLVLIVGLAFFQGYLARLGAIAPGIAAAAVLALAAWHLRRPPRGAFSPALLKVREADEGSGSQDVIPFTSRLKSELRALGAMYAAGALTGAALGWMF